MPSSDAVSTAKNAVLSWSYLAKTNRQAEILTRLTNRPEAHKAWRVLFEKELIKGTFEEVASTIGRRALDVPLTMAEMRTSREIGEAANQAASLAKELVKLIERNATLKLIPYELMHPAEYAALERVLGGLTSHKVENQKEGQYSEDVFSSEIERELDAIQARDHPEFQSTTTSHAYRVLRAGMYDDAYFLERLNRFAQLAEKSATIPPIVPNPKRASTPQRIFAMYACSTLVGFYGSPNCDPVADLAAAAFDAPVSTETIKKWWQRRDGRFSS